MYCRNCGTQLIDGSNYCPYCGNEIDKKDIVVPKEPEIVDWSGADKNPNEIRVPKVWSVFAKLSKIFGIVSISTCWIPIFGLAMISLSIPGIVFGGLGKKGKANDTVAHNSNIGLILSIIATVLSIICYILFIVLLVWLGMSSASYYNDYYYYY